MFQTICDLIPADPDIPERARRLDILRRMLNGSIYDVLPYDFHEERTPGGEYIPLRLRRPSVRYAMARIVTEDSVALLFSEGHFPTIDSPRPRHARHAYWAAQGSPFQRGDDRRRAAGRHRQRRHPVARARRAALLKRDGHGEPDAGWRPDAPDTLAAVVERYKLPGSSFAAAGYTVPDLSAAYWFMRKWGRHR